MSNLVPHTDVDYPELSTPLDGRYQVIEILMAKLWARTYLAQDLRRPSQSECIIHHLKVIPMIPDYAEIARELLTREAAILEQVGMHSQIPQLLAYFEDTNGFYIVQELIQGRSLSTELQPQMPWQVEDVVCFLQDALEPLAMLHRYGSMHGNLKPQNILRREQDGRLVLIDIHSLLHIQLTLMAAHGLAVPPLEAAQRGYQPLEQLQGLPCPASDVYAIGMIAIQLLTGVQPTEFRVNPQTTVEILWKEHLPPSISRLQQGLVALLDNMVQWDVSQRFANAEQALMALQDLKQMCLSMEQQFALEKTRVSPAALPPISTVERSETSGFTTMVVEPGPMPNSSKQVSFFLKTLLIHAITSPSLRVSAGGIAIATTCAAIGWGLLNSVDWSDKSTKLWERFTRATDPSNHPKHQSGKTVKAVHQQWQKDWNQASITFQRAETAFKQRQWAEAKQLSTNLPNIPYWQYRGNELAAKAISQAETEASKLIQSAYDSAYQRNFTEALAQLNQIMPETSVGKQARAKIVEYREKQVIKAWADLQKAYDQAIVRNFSQALIYLYQIPKETPAYTIAQRKIVEYKEKEKIRARILLGEAKKRAEQSQLQAAILSLQKISPGTSVDAEVEVKVEVYTQQLNQQAEIWLSIARQQVKDGFVTDAIATLENIPIGTAAYAQAREQIAELTALSQMPEAPAMLEAEPMMPTELASDRPDLNPGHQLREPHAVILSRTTFDQPMNQ
ncbi:serine/threonine protein kinase [Leptolyngbyaceae cyanobacterium JSC-12]|nr:serine/threonine protein kinase [Leptolyngbyaceae cyanobacterium JSC-12]